MARSCVQNLKRRGAAYWWRRLISLNYLGKPEKFPISLEFRLNSKELDTARRRSAAMTAYCERLKMSFRDDVAKHGLDERTIATLFRNELRAYRNDLFHLEAAWKANPKWRGVSDRGTDLSFFVNLWQGVADDGLGGIRDWDFVERHFADYDLDLKLAARDLIRRTTTFSESMKQEAACRLKELGVPISSVSVPVAVSVIARARTTAATRVRNNTDMDALAGCCQTNRNQFPLGSVRAGGSERQATRDCHSASAAERNSLKV